MLFTSFSGIHGRHCGIQGHRLRVETTKALSFCIIYMLGTHTIFIVILAVTLALLDLIRDSIRIVARTDDALRTSTRHISYAFAQHVLYHMSCCSILCSSRITNIPVEVHLMI